MRKLICALALSISFVATAAGPMRAVDSKKLGKSSIDRSGAVAQPAAESAPKIQIDRKPALGPQRKGPLAPQRRGPLGPQLRERETENPPGSLERAAQTNVFRFPLSLKVQAQTGDFESWTQELTVNERGTRRFRWRGGRSDAATARWEVSDFDPSRRARQGTSVLAQGSLPMPGSASHDFQIPFSFMPQWPPAPPHVYHYWVTVKLLDEQGLALGEIAPPVKLSYRAAAGATRFNICDRASDCASDEYCRSTDATCQPLVYTCSDGSFRPHLIRGTDGSEIDCTPYACSESAGLGGEPGCLRAPCASTADCAHGWVCDDEAHCVTPCCSQDSGCPDGYRCAGIDPDSGAVCSGHCERR